MSTMHNDLERSLTTWLDAEAPTREPTGLADSVLSRTARTRRRPGWIYPERWLPLETTARLGPASRALVITAVIGLLAALLVGVLAVAGQRSLPPPWGPVGNGLIAFVNNDDDDIWTVRADGSARRPLLRTPDSHESAPLWSRDGTHLAFWSYAADGDSEDVADLVVIDENGEGLTIVAADIDFPGDISWDRDGTLLAFSAGLNGVLPTHIYVAAADGSGFERISDPETNVWSPSFSPDGWTIAFGAGNFDRDRGLFLMDRDGSDVRQLSHETGGEFYRTSPLEWSPDGQFILTSVGSGDRVDARIFRVDGLHEIRITEMPSRTDRPYGSFAGAWSPDGEHIAYVRDTSVANIVITRPDGSESLILDHIDVDSYSSVAWSPDGSRLVATAALETNDTESSIVILDPSGEMPSVSIPGLWDWSWQRVAS